MIQLVIPPHQSPTTTVNWLKTIPNAVNRPWPDSDFCCATYNVTFSAHVRHPLWACPVDWPGRLTIVQVGPDVEALLLKNKNRGPDHQGSLVFTANSLALTMHSTVLHLRGSQVTPQPYQPHSECPAPLLDRVSACSSPIALSFNGEIYGGLDGILDDSHLDTNDTAAVAEFIAQNVGDSPSLLKGIAKLKGEWSMCFYQLDRRRLWFGRDCLGRRSLVVHYPSLAGWVAGSDLFLISSVTAGTEMDPPGFWTELPADGMYCLDLRSLDEAAQTLNQALESTPQGPDASSFSSQFKEHIRHFPWSSAVSQVGSEDFLPSPLQDINSTLPSVSESDQVVDYLLATTLPNEFPVLPEHTTAVLRRFDEALSNAVRRRVQSIPKLIQSPKPHAARLGVLFSGGLDCIALAALAHRHLPLDEPIDLLNVGFENPRVQKAQSAKSSRGKKRESAALDSECDSLSGAPIKPVDAASATVDDESVYNVPDRLTGLSGLAELKESCPGRQWNFVKINITYKEAMEKKDYIASLMMPLSTVMDLSIAMAFWFASRGEGVLHDDNRPYSSPARVLLSGLGADEQLGGYGRHKVRFDTAGWAGLYEEIKMDLGRISERNMGRDDRIIADHGKEVRFPFLDEGFVNVASSLPVYHKADLRFRKGIGEKLVLRMYVQRELGLTKAATEPKRAVQFGARTAKMEHGREAGTDRI